MRVFGCSAVGVLTIVAAMLLLIVASIIASIVYPDLYGVQVAADRARVVASQSATQSVTLDGTQAEMVYTLPASSVSTVNVLPVLFLAFCFFAFLVITALALMAMAKGRQSNSNPGETALLQSMNAGLSGMEQRLEALETLILEKKV